jgi:inositol polyphosphate 5-phosphatase INPP5B/F
VQPDDLNDGNPDLIVLGFQELDLSPKALLYSMGTDREDVWCMSVTGNNWS